MRRVVPFLVALSALLVLTSGREAFGQLGGLGVGSDPFSFYYGYYLPHQQYMAAQPTPLDAINRVTANRQVSAATDRAALYDPISPYGDEDLDPLRPYNAGKRGLEHQARGRGSAMNDPSNARGAGPAGYYNRTAQYFPTLRTGRGPNQNLAPTSPRRGGSIGSMPQAPSAGGLTTR